MFRMRKLCGTANKQNEKAGGQRIAEHKRVVLMIVENSKTPRSQRKEGAVPCHGTDGGNDEGDTGLR